jgi:hypothetical protein
VVQSSRSRCARARGAHEAAGDNRRPCWRTGWCPVVSRRSERMCRAPRSRGRGDRMRGLPIVLVLIYARPALAAECPAASSEAVLSALRTARSCRGAAQTYRACTRATTQDVQFAEAVVGKCESGFVARLTPKQRASYQRQIRSERKYARETGTMYRSFAASCRVNVALRFARALSSTY